MKTNIYFRCSLYLSSLAIFILNAIQKELSVWFIIIALISTIGFAFISYVLLNASKKAASKINKSDNSKSISKQGYFLIAISIFLIFGILEYAKNTIANYAFILSVGFSIASIINELSNSIKERRKES